jgi:hypothetical protein
MANEAAQVAERLVELLGVNPTQLRRPMDGSSQVMLPSIYAWYEDPALDMDQDGDENESAYSDDEDNDADGLQALVDAEEQTLASHTNKQDDELLALTCASLAITADDITKV